MLSLPLSPSNVSFPAPPATVSLPSPAETLSLPLSPDSESLAALPVIVSLPSAPKMVSAPMVPDRTSLPAEPVTIWGTTSKWENGNVSPRASWKLSRTIVQSATASEFVSKSSLVSGPETKYRTWPYACVKGAVPRNVELGLS
jgi:hypothetical protein